MRVSDYGLNLLKRRTISWGWSKQVILHDAKVQKTFNWRKVQKNKGTKTKEEVPQKIPQDCCRIVEHQWLWGNNETWSKWKPRRLYCKETTSASRMSFFVFRWNSGWKCFFQALIKFAGSKTEKVNQLGDWDEQTTHFKRDRPFWSHKRRTFIIVS